MSLLVLITEKNLMAKQKQNTLRIIGGKWRGRKVAFEDVSGLRPTHDRVRETLFNWLQTDIIDARCLDMFAGSGALGLEALSRGAEYVVFLDNAATVVKNIENNLTLLNATNAHTYLFDVTKEKATAFLGDFDIVFIDPPFHQGLWCDAINFLFEHKLLKPDALIYLELETDSFDADLIPQTLEILRHKSTKTLSYLLLKNCH